MHTIVTPLTTMRVAQQRVLIYQPVTMIQTTTWSEGCFAMMYWNQVDHTGGILKVCTTLEAVMEAAVMRKRTVRMMVKKAVMEKRILMKKDNAIDSKHRDSSGMHRTA